MKEGRREKKRGKIGRDRRWEAETREREGGERKRWRKERGR